MNNSDHKYEIIVTSKQFTYGDGRTWFADVKRLDTESLEPHHPVTMRIADSSEKKLYKKLSRRKLDKAFAQRDKEADQRHRANSRHTLHV